MKPSEYMSIKNQRSISFNSRESFKDHPKVPIEHHNEDDDAGRRRRRRTTRVKGLPTGWMTALHVKLPAMKTAISSRRATQGCPTEEKLIGREAAQWRRRPDLEKMTRFQWDAAPPAKEMIGFQ